MGRAGNLSVCQVSFLMWAGVGVGVGVGVGGQV